MNKYKNMARYDRTQHLTKHLSTNENITKINMQQIFKHNMTRKLDKNKYRLSTPDKMGRLQCSSSCSRQFKYLIKLE